MGFMVKHAGNTKLSLANDLFHETSLYNIQGKERSHDPVVRNPEIREPQVLPTHPDCGGWTEFTVKHVVSVELNLPSELSHEALLRGRRKESF